MALFKVSKGLKANLPSAKTEGYCWYTTDDSLFYIDYKDENGSLQRKALNAKDAETLTGASLSTILNSSDVEIPTSKAVLDALNEKLDKVDAGSDWNQNDETQPDYVKNRPFYKAVEILDSMDVDITWDGDTTGRTASSQNRFYKVSDSVFTAEQFLQMYFICNGSEIAMSSPDVLNSNSKVLSYMDSGGPVIAVDIGGNISGGPPDTFPETGVYFPSDGSVTRLFSKEPVLTTKTTVKKIDEEFLPEDILNVKNEITNKLDRKNPNAFGSFSMGRTYPSVIGTNSCATGASIIASGNYSHAEGNRTTASGDSSHAEGHDTTASGNNSHAEGYMTTASVNSSHAEGYHTTASADCSHAEGADTTASGLHSHAEGDHTIASGVNSHAEGLTTKASSASQHVQGTYNVEDSSGTYAHIVGNGMSDIERSNAHTLDWSGNAWYAGDVYVGSTSGTNKDEGSKKLATTEYVDNSVSNPLNITSATVDQIAKITAVDDTGKPTTWETINIPTPFKPEGKYYLTFSSPNSFTLRVSDFAHHWDGYLEYFASNKTWTHWNAGNALSAVDNGGEYVLYLRGIGNTKIAGDSTNYKWVLSGNNIKCIGNIENLLDYETVASGNHPTMADRCYANMFYGCTALTQAPALPATTLTNGCYCSMFQDCTSLTQAPSLPATTLADWCYAYMFRGCTSLTQAPYLPATTLSEFCYQQMFLDCASLTQAPALPATTLTTQCYYQMFRGCTSLTQAPYLPATTLAQSCYASMFYGCTSLTKEPLLPATTLADSCYQQMFYGCTSLKLSSTQTEEYTQEYRIPTTGTGTTATDALSNMFTNTGGNFMGAPEINTTYYLSTDNMIVHETEIATLREYVESMIDSPFKPAGKSYLTFSSPSSFTLAVNDATKHWDGTLEYFASNKTWTTWDGTTTLSSVENDGEHVLYLRGTGNTVITGNDSNYKWVLTGTDIRCIGNIDNLLDYATVESGNHPTMASYCYNYMFKGCTALTQAPALPATTLVSHCYQGMFSDCTALTQAPAIPATTLAEGCYRAMFSRCTSLTQAPSLPAKTLAKECYSSMFNGCTSLTQAPELPATTLASHCYFYMFASCTSLTRAPALPATTLADYCYDDMFYSCSSLIQVPALPATTLSIYCYYNMFQKCSKIKLSSTHTGEYTQEYRIPTTGTGTDATCALLTMFDLTGGTFTGTPTINTTYYLSTDNMIVRDTEVATLNGYVGSMIDAAIGNAIGGSY